jgi:hypothetical protein
MQCRSSQRRFSAYYFRARNRPWKSGTSRGRDIATIRANPTGRSRLRERHFSLNAGRMRAHHRAALSRAPENAGRWPSSEPATRAWQLRRRDDLEDLWRGVGEFGRAEEFREKPSPRRSRPETRRQIQAAAHGRWWRVNGSQQPSARKPKALST